jgi:mono/diheme cytochrome c family protein
MQTKLRRSLALSIGCGVLAFAATDRARAQSDGFETMVKPVIQQSCSACHNASAMTGGLDLSRFLKESRPEALEDREVWEKVIRKLKAGEMPPPGMPRPPAEKLAAVSQWLEQQYETADADAKPDPGTLTVRRLNRYEYTNTVRDLLAVNLDAAADFPPDPYAYGFDNIGDALSLSPALTEMYLKAAQRTARAAIPLTPPETGASIKYDAVSIRQRGHMHIQTVHPFPVEADYNLRMAWEQQVPVGTVMTAHIFLDGKEVMKRTFAFTTGQERAVSATKLHVTQGPHKIEALMEVAPPEVASKAAPDSQQQPKPFQGPLPYPTSLEVIGPYHPIALEKTAAYQRIFLKGPPRGKQEAYARQILEKLAYRAYRRPVTKAEVDQLVNLTKVVHRHGGGFNEGIQIALEGILMSPNFLFRIERDPAGEASHQVSDYELASRLSYFLWSSMPDDPLLSLAAKGQLHDPEVLHAQTRRMLADAKAGALATNFAGEWLGTRNLNFEGPDAKAFPQYDVELRDAMQTETQMFFESIVAEDRSILDFLTGQFTFVNERLAKLYGIPGVQGRDFRRVDLEGTERSGILTQASVLTITSYPTRTSPTIRGKWILTNILNTPPPDPPANVPALVTSKEGGKQPSIRARLEMHRSNPVCASCHSGMDPLGFALENYDAIGNWRTAVDGLPVDASGLLPDGTKFSGAEQLKTLLMAQSPKFVDCLTDKLLTYALGRGLESSDRPAVKKIELAVEKKGYRFSALVDGIVNSAPFQMRQAQNVRPDNNQRAHVEPSNSASASTRSGK